MNTHTPLSLAILSFAAAILTAQAPNQQRIPPDYSGVQTVVPGIFVTPIPNAPFTATVNIISHEKLPNGTENVRTTSAQIARDSSGRTYNERRQFVPITFKGQPALLSAHIFDPATRLNIFLVPQTHLAREKVLPPIVAAIQEPTIPPLPRWPTPPLPKPVPAAHRMPTTPPVPGEGDPWGIMDSLVTPHAINQVHGMGVPGSPTSNPTAATALNKFNSQVTTQPITQIDLGNQTIDGITLHGTEKLRTIPAKLSTTGQPITITDQYWYSPDLAVYLIIKHNDPRTGKQIVGVTHIDRHEPPSTQFAVPANYKLVDETPPQ